MIKGKEEIIWTERDEKLKKKKRLNWKENYVKLGTKMKIKKSLLNWVTFKRKIKKIDFVNFYNYRSIAPSI